jgi:hypothetical protein
LQVQSSPARAVTVEMKWPHLNDAYTYFVRHAK